MLFFSAVCSGAEVASSVVDSHWSADMVSIQSAINPAAASAPPTQTSAASAISHGSMGTPPSAVANIASSTAMNTAAVQATVNSNNHIHNAVRSKMFSR